MCHWIDNWLLRAVQVVSALKAAEEKRGGIQAYHKRGLYIHLTVYEEETIAGR